MPDRPEGVAEDFITELATKAHDLVAPRKVLRIGERHAVIHISYLFTLYIGITAGGVTHRDLLLEMKSNSQTAHVQKEREEVARRRFANGETGVHKTMRYKSRDL